MLAAGQYLMPHIWGLKERLAMCMDDLKRWYTAEKEMKMDLVGVKYTGTEFERKWPTMSNKTNDEGCVVLESGRIWEDKHYLYPLPTDQLQLNPNLKQNPGWE